MQDHEKLLASLTELLRLGDLITPIAIRTASLIGLADQLEHEPTTAEALAQRLSVKVEPLKRLLGVLHRAGVLLQHESGDFSLTDVGRVMRLDHPLSMRDAFSIAPTEIRAWTQLEHCVHTGQSGFERSYGETHRNYRARELDEDIRMDRVHQAATRLDLLTLSRAYPWGDAPTIVDVGGGTGTFLAGILRRFPHVRGTLFDLPRMVANAAAVLEENGVSERCTIVGGDFFRDVPRSADLYVLKAIVGGWSDDSCVRILTSARRAMRPDSRLLIIEPVMGLGGEPGRASAVQLHLLVLYGGRLRTLRDYGSLADAADLEVRKAVPRPTLSIIELTPRG